MTGTRDQMLVDLRERVLSEATRTIVRLENDGIDAREAIREVQAALATLALTEADLAPRLTEERRRSGIEDAPDDRELGGQG